MSKMQENLALAGDLPPASQTRFGFVLADWLHHPEVGVNEAAVLAALAIHANAQGECWPGQVLLGGLLDRGREWVGSVVDHLVEIGILERTRTFYGYRYRFLVWKAPKPAEMPNVGTGRHSNVASERHAEHHHKKTDSEESPLTPQGGEREKSDLEIYQGKKGRRRKLDPVGIAEAFERAACRVEAMQDAPPEVSDDLADGAIVPVSEAVLPALCPEENQAAGWILSICRDRASTKEWPADVRLLLLNHPELVEAALARRLKSMRGAPPATIARMLKVFQDRIATFQDLESLEAELTADLVTLAELPENLLHLAYKRVNAGWKAGFTRRPAAGDFMAAVKEELSDRRDEIRWLKTGLDRIYAERHRQDARRQTT